MEKKELEQFIEENHRMMTLKEMVDYSGNKLSHVHSIVQRRGFQVITIAEQTKNYILSHQHMSFNQLREKLELTENSLYKYLKALGIRISTKQYNIPLENILTEVNSNKKVERPVNKNKQTKADIINSFCDKYINTITWQDLNGNNTTPSWSSI